MKTFKAIILSAMLLVFSTTHVHASQVTLLIDKLVEKGILTRPEADSLRVEVEQEEKKDFEKQIKTSNGWLENLSSKGDIRLRYEGFNRESGEKSSSDNSNVQDRNRFRFRVRWGLEKKFTDEWKAGFRLATGTGTNEATSTNQTLTDEFGLKQIFIDRAYAVYTPTKIVQNRIPGVTNVEIGAGKTVNPWERWATAVVWDSDVNPEGAYERVDFNLAKPSDSASWDLHLQSSQFILEEDSNFNPGDQFVFAYGAGTTYQWAKDHNASFKITYYDWTDYAQFQNDAAAGLSSRFGGNDRGLDDIRVINFYADTNFMVETGILGKRNLRLYGDFAHNMNLNADPMILPDSDDAFSLGFTLNKAKEKGDWEFNYEYMYIEANAVPGEFSESDLHGGGTNNQGHRLSYKYKLHKNIDLNLTAWLAEKIEADRIYTIAGSDFLQRGDDDELLRFQADLIYSF